MPSIEVIAVSQKQPIPTNQFTFAVMASSQLQSHRGESSKFQVDFDKIRGIIYHLGNPELKGAEPGRCFFAYRLLSRASQTSDTFLEFAAEYRNEIEQLLKQLLAESSVDHVVFTSDWQFGPDWTRRADAVTLNAFLERHDSHKLLLNMLYPISK